MTEAVEHPAANEATPAPIAHTLRRHQAIHRREFTGLADLARKVERVRAHDPCAPSGHMHLDVDILFPRFEAQT